MRFLLLQSSVYYPGYGANKANRMLLEDLSARGHHCKAISLLRGLQGGTTTGDLEEAGAQIESIIPGIAVLFSMNGVFISAVFSNAHFRSEVRRIIRQFTPDWILVSSEDFGYQLLREAINMAAERVIYLARTTQLLPFGPRAFHKSITATELLSRARAIVSVSRYVSDYISDFGGIAADTMPLPSFGHGPFLTWPSSEDGAIVMINPCAVKGIAIFKELAEVEEHLNFAAVPTWGTTPEEIELLKTINNVSIWEPATDIDDIFRNTRILLVPSLWDDAFPKVVIEAMLRGIPVIASDVGGIREAMQGVDFLIHVNPILKYQKIMDRNLIPVPIIPTQDITPWRDALRRLSVREIYHEVAQASLLSARKYISKATVETFEEYCSALADR
jgi:glycosyltransferase involved in cell wall biosynthesis